MVALLVDLHQGLARLGPGSTAATLRALASCPELPVVPRILDLGCGAGAQTLTLASSTSGPIVAVDRIPCFLAELRAAARLRGLGERIDIVQADMDALPFADARFDLIWSEGAVYNIGFDRGLAGWRPLLGPGGYLVVSELEWRGGDPPPELQAYWRENYPAMRSAEENRNAARALGWRVEDHFELPAEAWTDYHGPLRDRIGAFRARHRDEPDAQAVADTTEEEMAVMDRYGALCGYGFHVLRAP
jgi:SAM-dependent methyltransferase